MVFDVRQHRDNSDPTGVLASIRHDERRECQCGGKWRHHTRHSRYLNTLNRGECWSLKLPLRLHSHLSVHWVTQCGTAVQGVFGSLIQWTTRNQHRHWCWWNCRRKINMICIHICYAMIMNTMLTCSVWKVHHSLWTVILTDLELVVTVPTGAGVCTLPTHMYCPACEVWTEENVRMELIVVSFWKSAVTMMSFPEKTSPKGPIHSADGWWLKPEMVSWTLHLKLSPPLPASTAPCSDTSVSTSRDPLGTEEEICIKWTLH